VSVRLVAAFLLTALALSGCETNAQRSAKLEKAARAERLAHPEAAQKGVTVTRESPRVKVLGTDVVHDENGIAAIVLLRNTSSKPLRNAPIAITVNDAKGATLYQNNSPGLDTALVSVALLKPRVTTLWVDDQIQAAGVPAKVNARVGEAPTASGALPQVSVSGLHTFADPSNGLGAEGTVTNSSKVAQQKLVMYVVARRGANVVAAGRAVLPEVGAGRRATFQVFFIGSPRGAKLEASAPPTTVG
jgi:hypothetical protein